MPPVFLRPILFFLCGERKEWVQKRKTWVTKIEERAKEAPIGASFFTAYPYSSSGRA